MATIGALTLIPTGFIIYVDPTDLVTQLLLDISTDWVKHQRNPNLPPFFNDAAQEYEARISPKWRSFLTTPMFEVMLESPALLRGVHRTVADMINHVQAREWMPPLSNEDREAHKKACTDLDKEQTDESIATDCHLQYGENDPLPLEYWVPSVFKEEPGLQMYCKHMTHVKAYMGSLHQWFYRPYGWNLHAEQIASLCLLWQIAGSCEEAFFLAKWMQPFSEMSCLGICHMVSIIEPPQMLPEYLMATGEVDWLKVPPLQLQFKTPLEAHAFDEENATGPYDLLTDGDPLMYAASFVDYPAAEIPTQVQLTYNCPWCNLEFFTPKELDLTVLAQDLEEGELGDEEEVPSTIQLAMTTTASTQQASSGASTGFMLDEQEPPACSNCAPMTDFQWECK